MDDYVSKKTESGTAMYTVLKEGSLYKRRISVCIPGEYIVTRINSPC